MARMRLDSCSLDTSSASRRASVCRTPVSRSAVACRFAAGPIFATLSLNESLRRGAELVVFPGKPEEIHSAQRSSEVGLHVEAVELAWQSVSRSRAPTSLSGKLDRHAKLARASALRCWGTSTGICWPRQETISGSNSMTRTRRSPIFAMLQAVSAFVTACRDRDIVRTSTTSSCHARWARR